MKCSVQVNIPAETGDMGILANHVASVEQLRPGVVDVIEDGATTKQFFRTSLLPNGLAGWMGVMRFDARLGNLG